MKLQLKIKSKQKIHILDTKKYTKININKEMTQEKSQNIIHLNTR